MRKLMPLPERVMYKGEDDIALSINVSKGQMVSQTTISSSEIDTMVEGESRIDYKNNSEVIKMNGKLYKRAIINNEIKLQEII